MNHTLRLVEDAIEGIEEESTHSWEEILEALRAARDYIVAVEAALA